MQQDNRDPFQAFLLGQVLLFGLLGASLAFFVAHRSLQTHWALPELRLVIQTAATLAAGIIALLAGVRFGVEGRRLDLFLCVGFLVAAGSTLAFSIVPVVGGQPLHRAEGWAGIVGRLFAWALIATAPFMRGRSKWGSRVLGNACLAACVGLLLIWTACHSFAPSLPAQNSTTVDPRLYSALTWRNLGPFRAGRVAAVSGAIGQSGVFYIGLPAAGVWKTTSAGESWYPVFDAIKEVSSIGAVEVAPSNPNVIYVGTGDIITGGSISMPTSWSKRPRREPTFSASRAKWPPAAARRS